MWKRKITCELFDKINSNEHNESSCQAEIVLFQLNYIMEFFFNAFVNFLKRLVLVILILAVIIRLRFGLTNPKYFTLHLLHTVLTLKHSLLYWINFLQESFKGISINYYCSFMVEDIYQVIFRVNDVCHV